VNFGPVILDFKRRTHFRRSAV